MFTNSFCDKVCNKFAKFVAIPKIVKNHSGRPAIDWGQKEPFSGFLKQRKKMEAVAEGLWGMQLNALNRFEVEIRVRIATHNISNALNCFLNQILLASSWNALLSAYWVDLIISSPKALNLTASISPSMCYLFVCFIDFAVLFGFHVWKLGFWWVYGLATCKCIGYWRGVSLAILWLRRYAIWNCRFCSNCYSFRFVLPW